MTLKYNSKWKLKATDDDDTRVITIGQGYIQRENQLYFVVHEHQGKQHTRFFTEEYIREHFKETK